MTAQVWALIGVVVSTVGALAVAKLSSRAQREQSAGELALEIAKEAREVASSAVAKGDRLEGRINAFRRFWVYQHEPWDAKVRTVLQRVDPEAAADLGPAPVPPLWDDDRP